MNKLKNNQPTAECELVNTICSAFGLYRPDGSLLKVVVTDEMGEEKKDHIFAVYAWPEIRPEDDHRAGIWRPEAENAAKAAGYEILPVKIVPNV